MDNTSVARGWYRKMLDVLIKKNTINFSKEV